MVTKTTAALVAAFILATASTAFAQSGQRYSQASSYSYDHYTNRDHGLQDRSINLAF